MLALDPEERISAEGLLEIDILKSEKARQLENLQKELERLKQANDTLQDLLVEKYKDKK